MLTAGANKAAKPRTGRCPSCGLTGSACRPVPLGYWCQRDGLEEDTSTWIVPSPDPVSTAVHADPKVIEALEVMEARQRDADAAYTAWLSALREISTHRIKAEGVVDDSGLWRPLSRSLRKAERLTEAEQEAHTALDEATTKAVRARTAYNQAVDEARLREINKDRERSSDGIS